MYNRQVACISRRYQLMKITMRISTGIPRNTKIHTVMSLTSTFTSFVYLTFDSSRCWKNNPFKLYFLTPLQIRIHTSFFARYTFVSYSIFRVFYMSNSTFYNERPTIHNHFQPQILQDSWDRTTPASCPWLLPLPLAPFSVSSGN